MESAAVKKMLIEQLSDDLNYIRNNIPEYIQVVFEGIDDNGNQLYFVSLINDVASLRGKIEQAIEI